MNFIITKESNGMHYDPNLGKQMPIYRPCNNTDCPYYENGVCYARNPMKDYDDLGAFWEPWEEWENA